MNDRTDHQDIRNGSRVHHRSYVCRELDPTARPFPGERDTC